MLLNFRYCVVIDYTRKLYGHPMIMYKLISIFLVTEGLKLIKGYYYWYYHHHKLHSLESSVA